MIKDFPDAAVPDLCNVLVRNVVGGNVLARMERGLTSMKDATKVMQEKYPGLTEKAIKAKIREVRTEVHDPVAIMWLWRLKPEFEQIRLAANASGGRGRG